MNTSLGDILEDYEKLIPITILGIRFEVPENNTFLRLLQYLRFNITYGKFCWNGDCKNCAFRYRGPDGRERTALGCQTVVQENMAILRLPVDTSAGDSSPASGG
jgi:hypothetical protein